VENLGCENSNDNKHQANKRNEPELWHMIVGSQSFLSLVIANVVSPQLIDVESA